MSTDDLDQIARLFRLRESGALTQAEFEAEKARVLNSEGSTVADEASPPEPVEAATFSDAAQPYGDTPGIERYRQSKGPLTVVLLTTVLAAGAGAGWYATRSPSTTTERGVVENSSPIAPNRAGSLASIARPGNRSAFEPQPSTAASVAPVEASTPTVQQQSVSPQTSAKPVTQSPGSGGITSGSPGRISGSPDGDQAPTEPPQSEEAISSTNQTKGEECERLEGRLERAEARVEQLGFKAQVNRINGISYSQTGPIIADAIATIQRYRAALRGKEPTACVDIGREGIARVSSILQPLARQN